MGAKPSTRKVRRTSALGGLASFGKSKSGATLQSRRGGSQASWLKSPYLKDWSPTCRFADWPNPAVPEGSVGIYTIWSGKSLLYVGMSGRGPVVAATKKEKAAPKTRGLAGRLDAHASGRRSGDQFCIYVFDRLVLPRMTTQQVREAAAGNLSIDELVRSYIRSQLSYRFMLFPSGREARDAELQIISEGVRGQWPLFQDLKS